jgi:hypothetical protein
MMNGMVRRVLALVVVVGCAHVLAGCCKENESKTTSCSHTKNAEECKTCCGGSYAFASSCTCY